MNVTLAVDVGDEERVLLVPRHEGEYAKVGTVAEVGERVRLPGGGRAVTLHGLHRGVAGAAHTGADGQPARRGRRAARRGAARASRPRELETRVPRDRRGDPRAARRRRPHLARSCARSARPARWPTRPRYAPDITFDQKIELLEAVDVVERLELAAAPAARAARRAAGAPPHPRGRGGGRRRSSSASTSCAARWSRSARSSARTTRRSPRTTARRSPRPACRTPSASRPSARSPGSSGWATRPRESSMIRTYLDWLLAVPWGKRSEERLDPVHAREVLDADHAGLEDVKDRIVEYLAVRKLRAGARDRRGQAVRRDPDADRAARHRQDLDRRVDRPRAEPRVRPHVARRRPRRGRDPRPPPHLHRRAAGPARPRAAGRRDDEPGDPARRGRQGRRRLARRSVGGAARGARPGAEPLVPRPLPRRRARPLARSCSSRPRTSPTRSPARCSTGWR